MIVVLGRCPNGIKIFISCCTGSMKKFEDASGRREVLDVEKKKVQECIRRGRVIRQADNFGNEDELLCLGYASW